jgi:hypothetical protein
MASLFQNYHFRFFSHPNPASIYLELGLAYALQNSKNFVDAGRCFTCGIDGFSTDF